MVTDILPGGEVDAHEAIALYLVTRETHVPIRESGYRQLMAEAKEEFDRQMAESQVKKKNAWPLGARAKKKAPSK